MRLLIDECVDERLRLLFPDHDCQTARFASNEFLLGETGLGFGDMMCTICPMLDPVLQVSLAT